MNKQTRITTRETFKVPVYPRYRQLHVMALGGGTGLANLLKGLKKYVRNANPGPSALEPRITELSAVVTVTDDGSCSGRVAATCFGLRPQQWRRTI